MPIREPGPRVILARRRRSPPDFPLQRQAVPQRASLGPAPGQEGRFPVARENVDSSVPAQPRPSSGSSRARHVMPLSTRRHLDSGRSGRDPREQSAPGMTVSHHDGGACQSTGAACGYSHDTAGRVHTPPWHWSPLISPLSAASSSPWWRPREPTHPGPHLPTRRQRHTRHRRRAPRCPRPRRFPPLSAGRRTTMTAPATTTSPGRRRHSADAHPPHLGAPSTGAPTPQPAPRGTEGRPTSRRRSTPTQTPLHPGRARHGPSRRCRPRHRPLPHHGRGPRRQTPLPPVRRPRPLTTPTGHLHRRRHEPSVSPRRRRAPPALPPTRTRLPRRRGPCHSCSPSRSRQRRALTPGPTPTRTKTRPRQPPPSTPTTGEARLSNIDPQSLTHRDATSH
jgi:hypothetical protein